MSPTPSCPACGVSFPIDSEAPSICPECGAACAEPEKIYDAELVAGPPADLEEVEDDFDDDANAGPIAVAEFVRPAPSRRKWLWLALRVVACLLFAVFMAGGIFAWMCWDDLKAWTASQLWLATSKPPTKPPPPTLPPKAERPGFASWEEDFETAKREAAKTGKDVLILFDGSDWSDWSARLTKEVFHKPPFRERAGEKFVLVHIEFKGRNFERNARIKAKYAERAGIPCVVLTDAQGQPYGQLGYHEVGPEKYLELLEELKKQRLKRDELFKAVAAANGLEKLAAAKETIDHLRETGFLDFYGTMVEEWVQLARRDDPRNEHGYGEVFFEVDWMARARKTKTPAARTELVASLAAWKKAASFKDPDRAATLHLYAARLLVAADPLAAMDQVRTAADCRPANRALLLTLFNSVAALGVYSASGLVISADGLILTSAQAVKGDGQILVRLPDVLNPVPADILDRDDLRDLALLRITPPPGTTLKPLKLRSVKPSARGEQVAAFGFPLGDWFGTQVKLTTGVIAALPEPNNEWVLIVDAQVNPGNRGGPLCDTRGNVVGMIVARDLRDADVDGNGNGLAAPAADLCDFVKKHIKDFRPAPPRTAKVGWDEVDRTVSASLLLILKVPAGAQAADDDKE